MTINTGQLARFPLFTMQLGDNHIPEDTAYRLFIQPFLETNGQGMNEKWAVEGLISGLLFSARMNGAEKSEEGAGRSIDLGGITLSTHAAFLMNTVRAHQQARAGSMPVSPHITNLRVSARVQAGGSKVRFNGNGHRSFSFNETAIPGIFALACYRGLYRPVMDTFVNRSVIDSFLERVSEYPKREQGAMLSGLLCRDSDKRFLHIKRLIPFDVVGREEQLNIPASEVWRASRIAEKAGERVCGFIHNHPEVEHAQGMSSVDIENMYQNYFHPFTRSIIVDTGQTLGKRKPVTCTSCPYFKKECSYIQERKIENFLPGYSMYGWDSKASLFSMPVLICDD
jgi:hypothetical protein